MQCEPRDMLPAGIESLLYIVKMTSLTHAANNKFLEVYQVKICLRSKWNEQLHWLASLCSM